MIRFACPGCPATFTVEDEKAGKAGKCPKCQSHFVIPDMTSTAPSPAFDEFPELSRIEGGGPVSIPSLPPPPVSIPTDAVPSSTDPVEIQPCPKCLSRLSVLPSDLGVVIACPNCQCEYQAKRVEGPPPKRGGRGEPSGDLVRLGSGGEELADEDRPSHRRRGRSRDSEDDDERPSRRRRRDDDESEDDPDRKYRRRQRYADDFDRRLAPHRGTMILVFGILGFTVCPVFSILAWAMGSQDIREMDEGRMDPEGRGLTRAGQIMGVIVCLLSIMAVVFYCGLVGLVGFR